MLWAFTKLKEVEELLTAGDLVTSFGKSAQHLANVRTLIETLPPQPHPDVTFLFKGSCGMLIEKIVWEFGQSAAYPLA
jgi:UDP-N-acetylmuramyl pentapeptide synthase